MPLFSTTELAKLRDRGLWAGPGESEVDFFERVKRCTSADFEKEIPQEEWERGADVSERCFGFRPDWIETSVGRSSLLFAGGADMGSQPRVELSERVWRRSRPIPRDELLAHEWFHVARCRFEEARFEEIIAFTTSRRWWRRFFSPIVQSTREVIVIALVCFATPFFALMSGPHPLLPMALLFGFLGARLFWRQWLWGRTSNQIGRSLAAQLTDREIRRFAFMDEQQIWLDIERRSPSSVRLCQLLAVRAALGGVAKTKSSSVLSDGSPGALDPPGS